MDNRKIIEKIVMHNLDYYGVTTEEVKDMSEDELIELTVPRVEIYNSDGKFVEKRKVTEVKSGMYVKDAYEDKLLKVIGNTYEDPEDYIIPTEDCGYSPLLLK